MSSNDDLWLIGSDSRSLEVKSAPYSAPGENKVVIRLLRETRSLVMLLGYMGLSFLAR